MTSRAAARAPPSPVDPVVVGPRGGRRGRGCGPRTLDEFVGQPELVGHLSIVLEAARRRGQPSDHLLFAGPPGLGKTTLAGIVAQEMGVGLRITSGPVLARAGDLAATLTDLAEGDVLFIDEIHRLPRTVEEVLYPAMEEGQLDVMLGKGPTARSICASTFPGSPSSARRRGPVSSPARCATGSGSSAASTSTTPPISSGS